MTTAHRWRLVCVALLLAASTSPRAAPWEDALSYRSADERFTLRLGGRIHADVAHIDYEDPTSDATLGELRRARLSVSGKAFGDWRFRYEQDFAADQDDQIKDAWIAYQGFERVRIRAGNQQEPQGLDELTSSNAITFMERALPNAFVSGYALGLAAETWGEQWTAALGLFEGDLRGREDGVDQGWGLTGRAVYSPALGKGQRLHLGASLAYREPPGNDQVSLSTLPEVHLSDRRLVATGTLNDVDYTLTSGLELAALWGRWSLQGEYLRTDVQRAPRPDVVFHGWYVYGSWFVAGGQRAYDARTGSFAPVRPDGRWGALELALRYSVIDLEDGPITGGEERNWTLGLNWYINRNTRVMVNLVHAEADPSRDGGAEGLDAIQSRLQFFF